MSDYGLDITAVEVPELPNGMSKDTIQYKDDYLETADVFGFVPIKITSSSGINSSSRIISAWLAEKMRCDELAIGQIQLVDNYALVSVHSSKVSLAMKAFEKYEFSGEKLTAMI